MSIISAVALFASWVASTFIGFAMAVTYSEWRRKKDLEQMLNALIREATGHVE